MQLNESIKVDKYKKLKDSIHDIVTKIPKDKWLTVSELSKKLKEHNINMPTSLLAKFLTDWKNGKKNPIFLPLDSEWLFFDSDNNSVFSTLHFQQPPSMGKSRRKISEKEKKEAEEAEEKKRKSDIEKLKEQDKAINSPIPSEVILDTFQEVDVSDVTNIMKNLYTSIESGEIESLYEPAWEQMIKIGTTPISEGGFGLELKDDTWEQHKPDDQWVVPEEKDLDKGVPVWYFKYGKGVIDDVTDNMLEIKFDDIDGKKTDKKLKTFAVLKNKSIRINKDYVKNNSNKKGYDIAYLKDLKVNDEIYHKTRKKDGVIKSIPTIMDKDIKLTIDDKTVKLTVGEFLRDQNILTKEKTKSTVTSSTNGSSIWKPIKTINDFKDNVNIGDQIKYGIGNIVANILDIDYDTDKVTIKTTFNNSFEWDLNRLIDMNVRLKEGKIDGDLVKVKDVSELEVGMPVMYGGIKIKGNVSEINSHQIIIRNEHGVIITCGFLCDLLGIEHFIDKIGIWKIIPKKEDEWIKITNVKDLKIGDQIQYSEKRIDGIIKKMDDSLMFVDNEFGASVHWNKYYFTGTIGIWKKRKPKVKFKWEMVHNVSFLKKGDTVKAMKKSAIWINKSENIIGEITNIYKTQMMNDPNSSDELTIKLNDGTETKVRTKDITNTYKKVYIKDKPKQLDMFDQENRELNKFNKDKPFDINDYEKVTNIKELSEGDTVYLEFKKKVGKIEKINNGLISIKGDGLNITIAGLSVTNGNVYKRKNNLTSFSDAYKTTGNIGFNKDKSTGGDWVKIKSPSEFRKGLKVKHGNTIYTIDSIVGGTVSMKDKFGSSETWTTKGYIREGIYKQLTKIVDKTQTSKNDTEWIKITDPSELKKDMTVKYKDKEYTVSSIYNTSSGPSITLTHPGGSIGWDLKNIIKSGIYKKSDKTTQNIPDGLTRVKDYSELSKGMIIYINGKRKRTNHVNSKRIDFSGGGASANMDTEKAIEMGIYIEKSTIKRELPSPLDGWKKITENDIVLGTKVYSILHNTYGEISAIKGNSIKIKLDEPKFRGTHKITALNTNKRNVFKEFLVKEDETDVDDTKIVNLVKHFKSFRSGVILRAAEFLSDTYDKYNFNELKKIIRTGINFGYINNDDKQMIKKILTNAKSSLERYKDKAPLEKTIELLKYF